MIVWIWVLTLVVAVAIVMATAASARRSAAVWNGEHFPKIEAAVESLVERYGPLNLCVEGTEGVNLLVSASHLHVIDENAGEVRRTVSIESIHFVNVHDESAAWVAFTIVCSEHDALPLMRVRSLASFASLFNVFIDFGKPIRFGR